MTEIRNFKFVLVIEYWNLRFNCNLVLGICDFEKFDNLTDRRSALCVCDRHCNRDRTSGPVVVFSRDRAPHCGDKLFHQSQPYTGSPGGSCQVTVHPVEVLEYFFQAGARDPRPGVGYGDLHSISLGPDLDGNSAGRR